MGNQTTVTVAGVGGAMAVIAIWLIGFYRPGLIESLPTGGEAALAVLFTAIFAYFKRSKT